MRAIPFEVELVMHSPLLDFEQVSGINPDQCTVDMSVYAPKISAYARLSTADTNRAHGIRAQEAPQLQQAEKEPFLIAMVFTPFQGPPMNSRNWIAGLLLAIALSAYGTTCGAISAASCQT